MNAIKRRTRILALLVAMTLCVGITACKPAEKDNSSTTGDASTITSGGDAENSDVDGEVTSEEGQTNNSSGDQVSETSTTKPTSSSGKTNSNTSSKPHVDESFYPASLQGKTAKILLWDTPNGNTKLLYQNFEKVTGCKVEYIQTTYENYLTKLSGMVAAKDAPDVAYLTVRHYPTLMTKNLLQPVDKFVRKDDPVLDFSAMDMLKYNGSYWGVASSETAEHFVLFFNRTMFNDATNIKKNPLELYESGQWTWEALADLTEKMVQKDNTGKVTRYGLALDRAQTFMNSTGIDFIKVDGNKITNQIKDPRIKESWSFIKKLTFEDNFAIKISNPASYFASGKAAMFIEGSWAVDRGSETAPLKQMKDKWDWVPFPKYSKGTSYQPIESGVWGVPYRAKNPEAGYYLARFIVDPNSLEGVEGAADPHKYHTEADKKRLQEVYSSKKCTTIAQGIMGDQLWDLWWDLLNPEKKIATEIDSWSPKIDAPIFLNKQKPFLKSVHFILR